MNTNTAEKLTHSYDWLNGITTNMRTIIGGHGVMFSFLMKHVNQQLASGLDLRLMAEKQDLSQWGRNAKKMMTI